MLTFEFTDKSLIKAVESLPSETQTALAAVVKATTEKATKLIKGKTPVESGKAKAGWKSKSRGVSGAIFNNVDYINVLELGGYPVRSAKRATRQAVGGFRRGNAILGGLSPGPKTRRAAGGAPAMTSNVSKKAPKGMVRSTLEEIEPQFVIDITDAINSLPSWKR